MQPIKLDQPNQQIQTLRNINSQPQQPQAQPPVVINHENFQPPAIAVDDDLSLQYTQTVRAQLARNMMADGALSGHDTKQTNTMLQVLRDMDSQSIAKKRIKSEEKNGGALSEAAALVNRVLDAIDPTTAGVNPHVAPIDVAAREVRTDESFTAVPGEMDVNPQQLNYNEFVAKMRSQRDQG